MKLSIYITDTCIQYILGDEKKLNINIDECGTVELNEGIMKNGYIHDDEQLFNTLLYIKQTLKVVPKKVELLIDNNLIGRVSDWSSPAELMSAYVTSLAAAALRSRPRPLLSVYLRGEIPSLTHSSERPQIGRAHV